MGHSHPEFNCYYCGAKSPFQYLRDKNGVIILDDYGTPKRVWVGWKYK